MRRALLTLLAVLVLATPIMAAPVLKFDDPLNPGGLVSYNGTLGQPIVGADIQFQTITGLGTPLNSGVTLACVGCLLDFATGGVTTEGPSVWSALGGGTLTLTGAIPALGLAAGTTLVSGAFSGAPLNPTVTAAGTSGEFTGFGEDTKHETLAAFFGLGEDFVFLATEIALTTTRINPDDGSFSAIPNNSDFNNASVVVSAPGAGLLLLLGGLMLGSARYRPRTGRTAKPAA
jgi:hypothetical protein